MNTHFTHTSSFNASIVSDRGTLVCAYSIESNKPWFNRASSGGNEL